MILPSPAGPRAHHPARRSHTLEVQGIRDKLTVMHEDAP